MLCRTKLFTSQMNYDEMVTRKTTVTCKVLDRHYQQVGGDRRKGRKIQWKDFETVKTPANEAGIICTKIVMNEGSKETPTDLIGLITWSHKRDYNSKPIIRSWRWRGYYFASPLFASVTVCCQWKIINQFNKLTSVFHASVPLLIINKWTTDHFDDVMTKFIVSKRTDVLKSNVNLLFTITSCQIVRSRPLAQVKNMFQTSKKANMLLHCRSGFCIGRLAPKSISPNHTSGKNYFVY